ncbi:transcriptional regulator GlxA family with amidase domain [Nocardia transvalensis]|uniref:Transcriptional regulator GlxA family with amidase domain n=1 Tax=Nocardia transvalensis TaxID=37333 RepID=A0A7W9UMI0_9NOCA|nr:helix-turn-helix domain-containing protein [Nocardia transvalensis]MBB5918634.1 transcriptional regulator GlxA family with amidase domain [Nocardia transvalensis]
MTDSRPHTIAVAVAPGQPVFEVAIPYQVFGEPPLGIDPAGWYDLRLCGPRGVRHATLRDPFVTLTDYDYDDLIAADTVVVPATPDVRLDPPPDLVDAVRAAYEAGARVAALCSGAFVLAAAGLLDGRRTTTHWKHVRALLDRHPHLDVDPAVLYIDDGRILTSAGTMAGMDLCLHLIRKDLGSQAANAAARGLVVPPHRAGGQAQYLRSPVPVSAADPGLAATLQWALERLETPLTVGDLAKRTGLSERTLARRFHAELGSTPLRWLLTQRILRARELLEATDLPVDMVAAGCGLGSAANLRAHFGREVGISPSEYRRTHRADKHEVVTG